MPPRGRPRKSSNSTVATIDDAHFPWSRETAVLKPVQPGISDNDWPTFVLYDAVIYEKDGRTLANPLLVDQIGPMIVRGKLEIDGEEITEHLVKPNTTSASIEIFNSRRYAIGYDDRLLPSLWVSGVGGWYEIRPAPKYELTYLDVCEAITLYYEALQVYEKYNKACGRGGKKKKPKNPPPEPTLDQVFFKYAIIAGDGVTRDEAGARYRKWAPFLHSHFPKETELKWEGTSFAKWIDDAYLEQRSAPQPRKVTPALEARLSPKDHSGEMAKAKSNREARSNSKGQDVEMADSAQSPMQKSPFKGLVIGKGKPRASHESPVPIPAHYPVPAQYRKPEPSLTPKASSPVAAMPGSALDLLLDALAHVASERDLKKKAAKETINNALYFSYRIKSPKVAIEITTYFAKQLVAQLPHEWRGTGFYQWLQSVVQDPPPPPQLISIEDIPGQFVRRIKSAKEYPRVSKNAPVSLPPTIDLKYRAKRAAQLEEDDDDSEEGYGGSPRGRKSGKGAGLRLVSSKKRFASDLDHDDDSAGGSRRGTKSLKRGHTMSDDDDDNMEDANDHSNVTSTINDDDSDEDGLPPPPKDALRVVVHAERIPTTSPAGPNGTWICEQEDCGYIVRRADEEAGQALIKEHFRDHEAQLEKVNLARKESRGHMPINYLLDKIQGIGKKVWTKKTGTLNGDQPLPTTPIKRRLLV